MMLRRKERSYKELEGSNPYDPLLCDEQQNFGEIVTIII